MSFSVPLYEMTAAEEGLFDTLFHHLCTINYILRRKYAEDLEKQSLLRDLWLAFYKEERVCYSKGRQEATRIRHYYIETMIGDGLFQHFKHKTVQDEQISLLYAVIYLEYIQDWVEQKIKVNELLRYYATIFSSFYRRPYTTAILPRDVVMAQRGFIAEIKYICATKDCEVKIRLRDAYRAILNIENVISCKNHLDKKRMLIPQHLATLFSVFYARYVVFY